MENPDVDNIHNNINNNNIIIINGKHDRNLNHSLSDSRHAAFWKGYNYRDDEQVQGGQ